MKTQFCTKKTDIGLSIEEKVRQASASNTPLEAISPMIYTDAKNGVQPELDIRTDRQEIALDAIDHYQASEAAKRDGKGIMNDYDQGEEIPNEEPKNE